MDDRNGTDGKSNGPGTGDTPASTCTNEHQGADSPQGGANFNPGPYDNTCDGRISQNGQGDDAPGKGTPCAGCVGNADDKNPPGQVKEWNGEKSNDMGYECDGNQGVGAHYGNGNPAHTGCQSPSVTALTCPSDSERNAGMPIPDGQTAETFCKNPPPETAQMSITVDCFTVTVTSTKDISNVVVVFADGTSQKFEGLSGQSFTRTFTKALSSATAKSATTTVSGTAPTICASAAQVCPSDSERNAGMPIPAGETVNSFCKNPPPTCPSDSERNAGMPIPPGHTEESFCKNKKETCPTNSPLNPGMPIPPGQTVESWCNFTPPQVCPADSPMAGQPVPGGDVNNCYITPPVVCPADSPMAGQPVPGGNVNNCFPPSETCPAGTEMAGEPIPAGGIAVCDDEVGGDIINQDGDVDGDKGDDVLGNRAGRDDRPPAAVLPFTGTSILAYVLVGLQMIGAGALIVRGRRRR